MATDKDVQKLKRYVKDLKEYLRDQVVWERTVKNNLRRLNSRVGLNGPTVTDPPKPPRP